MTLYTLLKIWLLPPGFIILLLAAGLSAFRRAMGRTLVLVAALTLWLMSLPVVSAMLAGPLECYQPLGPSGVPIPAGADAIVILGGGQLRDAREYGGDTLNDASLRRVRYGAKLHRDTGLPIYVTGGRFAGETRSVAELMAEVLMSDYQIPAAGVEAASRTTWENATLTAPMLAGDQRSHVLLVSDAWHLRRAVRAFERNGVSVTAAPTGFRYRPDWFSEATLLDWMPSARSFVGSYDAVHEYIGGLWYLLKP